MCNCGCATKATQETAKSPAEDKKAYVCVQCNTFKVAPGEANPPECCGKPMQEMD